MLLDGVLVLICLFAILRGKKMGLFRAVAGFLSFGTAVLATTLWGEKIRLWIYKMPWYPDMLKKLTETVEEAIAKGDTHLLVPFSGGAGASALAEGAAAGLAETILSGLLFAVVLLGVRLLISVLDRLVFHLPVIRPVNRLLGMLLSLAFTICIAYLVIGVTGGLGLFDSMDWLSGQMQSSVLVRRMYENNILLALITGKEIGI